VVNAEESRGALLLLVSEAMTITRQRNATEVTWPSPRSCSPWPSGANWPGTSFLFNRNLRPGSGLHRILYALRFHGATERRPCGCDGRYRVRGILAAVTERTLTLVRAAVRCDSSCASGADISEHRP
jgi:hypothetical protein